ncbi:DNA-binding protein D-ETS-4 isoform X2 [Condylostylus longicornis]|uniref:DNA-binding protein D-ETS-4 isoform X2 n=1 Tax=Condylostylus longicornis TaxID=2530218 RepID=UPI00244DFE68|nr:DNA-binding protein D-ETS-4 isoform X2 [Condylostylus longicornis]
MIKKIMSQLMSGTTSETLTNYTPDLYSTYADSFDLSLLSANDRDTLSILTGSTVSETIKNQSPIPSPIDPISTGDDTLDFIPKTIFNNNNDQLMTLHNNNSNNNNNNNTNQSSNNINSTLSSDNLTPSTIIKTEKLWNCDTTIQLQNNKNSSTIIDNNNYNINSPISNSTTLQQFGQDNQNCNTSVAAASLLFQQLQKQYQFYPSPLPSPPQYEFCNLNSVSSSINYSLYSPASSTLSPSPCPSLDQQQINTNNINFGGSTNSLNNPIQNFIPQVKQEYLILPPSPPESNGSPSPSLNQEIKSEPGDNEIETNLIEINILLEKTLQNLEEENQKNQKKEEQKLQNNQINQIQQQQQNIISSAPAQDHQLLREYLQDTSFQKKHNLKPLALESLIGGLGVRGDIEPVISLALEHAKRDAQATCAQLQISPDPQQWTTTQVHAWLRSTIEQFKLQQINELELKFPEDGINLLCLTEEEFIRRVPESGATIHAQLEIWKLACCDNFLNDIFPAGPSTSSNLNNNNNDTWPTKECDMDFTDDEDDDMDHQQSITTLDSLNSNENGQRTLITNLSTSTDYNTLGNLSQTTVTQSNNNITNAGNVTITQASTTTTTSSTATTTTTNATTVSTNSSTNNTPTTPKTPRTGGSHIHLWQFLKELLASPQVHGTAIRWLDRNKGVFKIEDSVRVAKLWGRRKNRPAMNYDKLSRSIRQYYKKGIMKKTERSQRLVYQFCPPYSG